MRYAIFTDIHANLEALEAVLAKIDEIAAKEPIDQIWFLGDLVGYGPDPNECIVKLRARTDVIIAGNHDWAAVGKIDLEEFSPAARISAEWTAEQLTEEHRAFLTYLPERLEIGPCTLVHGSPYGPLWEYLTEETLAERSFEYFTSRYCFVGHTHVPVIFQQPDVANAPTMPLGDTGDLEIIHFQSNGVDAHPQHESADDDDEETTEMAIIRSSHLSLAAQSGGENVERAFIEPGSEQEDDSTEYALPLPVANVDSPTIDSASESDETSAPLLVAHGQESIITPEVEQLALLETDNLPPEMRPAALEEIESPVMASDEDAPQAATEHDGLAQDDDETTEFSLTGENETANEDQAELLQQLDFDDYMTYLVEEGDVDPATPESEIAGAEERLNGEIEELLTLLGLSQSMIQITNEMLTPPEGHWEAPIGYRAIVNPGGVGQPRDGDPRAAFMIYDTERGFEFYRIPYDFEKTQEKIIKADLPQFLAVRLQFGR
jgi:diadenosine tetraphosphatase ApaH/serine/threonine PP2A family protein phosphatase